MVINSKNIVLLSVSTFNQYIKLDRTSESKYIYEDTSENLIIGRSQIEPIPKLMLKKYGNAQNLWVIMLCTKETIEGKSKFSFEPDETYLEEIKDEDSIQNVKELSASEFFMYRLADEHTAKSSIRVLENQNSEIVTYVQEVKNNPIHYLQVKIDEAKPEFAIQKIIEWIREQKNNQSLGRIWIDSHGGFREVSLFTNAVISLLRIDNIIAEKIYTIHYNAKAKSGRIIEADDKYKILEFVSAMDAFINYGSADGLLNYYKSDKKNISKELSNILNAMEKIASGTQTCATNIYDQGLNELGKAVNIYRKSEKNEELVQNPLFSTFIDYIEDDYGDLLDETKRSSIGIIERCVKKGLYQQALTYIESKMPGEFFEKKIFYYVTDSEIEKNLAKVKKTWNKKHDSNENFVFTNYLINKCGLLGRKWDSDKTFKQILNYCKNKQINNIPETFIENDFLEIKEKGHGSTVTLNIISDIKKNSSKSKKTGKLLRIHRALKDCRNQFNHVQYMGDPSIETIRIAIEKYVELVKEIF